MSTRLSADGQAIALLCSSLGLADGQSAKPLTLAEWRRFGRTLEQAGVCDVGDLLGRRPAELRRDLDVPTEIAERVARLLSRGGQLAFELDRLASRGIWVLTTADEQYPPRLKRLLGGDAPPVLYGAGSHGLFDERALAIVGSRDVGRPALEFAQAIARQCARERLAVVSGAARGVDLEAMGAAMSIGGVAIGVTVDPLERLVRRTQLREAIAAEVLTLVTPYHPAARWHVGNAMRRNRLVYALAEAAVVVATAAGSGGTWSGAVENLRHGWVPIYVRDDRSAGASKLARMGATPLPPESALDIDVHGLFAGVSPSPARGAHGHEPFESNGRRVPSLTGDTLISKKRKESPSADPLVPAGPRGERVCDAFTVVWPLLADCLQQPRSEREVAEVLHLQPAQARTWLNRALDEGLVNMRKRPRKLYVVEDGDPEQLTLT